MFGSIRKKISATMCIALALVALPALARRTMKAKKLIFTTFLLLIGGVSLLPGTAHGAINGKAAAVIQLVREPTRGEQPPMQSKLIVVTILTVRTSLSLKMAQVSACIAWPTRAFAPLPKQSYRLHFP
jgi:hypothetical protein